MEWARKLLSGILNKNTEEVQTALSHFPDFTQIKLQKNETVLSYAIRISSSEIVEILVKSIIALAKTSRVLDVANGKSDEEFAEMTPLCLAISKKQNDIVQILLDNGANPNKLTINSFPLIFASQMGDVSIIKILIEKGAEINSADTKTGNTALHEAARVGHENVVQFLLTVGADINATNKVGETPIFSAGLSVFFRRGPFPKIVEKLITAGSDINHKKPSGATLLFQLVQTQKEKTETNEIIKQLVMHPLIDINAGPVTPLVRACELGKIQFIREILKNPSVDFHKESEWGTPLAVACLHAEDLPIVKLLLTKQSAGLDINRGIAAHDITPLALAARKGNTEAVTVLLSKPHIDINKQAKPSGTTALSAACEHGQIEIVKQLLKAGADKNIIINIYEKSVKQLAEDGIFREEINELLAPASTKVWEGLTQDDVTRLNTIFDTDPPGNGTRPPAEDWSFCPICLGYASRENGCMFLKHSCKTQPNSYYHKELYEQFRDGYGLISWCTICGRICDGHKHYSLQRHDEEPVIAVAPPVTDTIQYYQADCKHLGGGGFDEKLQRFRQFKKHARELQSVVGKITEREALKSLIESVWNAPLSPLSPSQIASMKAAKEFNIPTTNFPLSTIKNTEKNANKNTIQLLDYRRPSGTTVSSITFTAGAPLSINTNKSKVAENVIGFATDGTIIYFRHNQLNGILRNHLQRQEGIGQVALIGFITEQLKSFGSDPAFMKCPFHSEGCGALLFPEEIYDFVPLELYKQYRTAFNRIYQMKKESGDEEGFTIIGVPYNPDIPYKGAIGGAGID